MQQMQKAVKKFNELNIFFKSSIYIILAFIVVLAGYGLGRLIGRIFL